MPELLREHFVVFKFFFLLLSPSVFHLLAVFQSVPLAFMLSYFSSSLLCLFYHFRRMIKLKLPLISHLLLRLRSVQSHSTRKKKFLEKCWYFYSFGKYVLLCVQASTPTKLLKSHSFLCSNKSLTFYLTSLSVVLASTQAREWHHLWWSLRTVYVLWSRRCVWWHHRSMPGECPHGQQSIQYTCAIELVTSEIWNHQEEESQ